MQIVIVGASFAGLSAALKAVQLYPEASVVVLDRQDKLAYIPNSLNWSLKEGKAFQDYRFFCQEDLEAAGVTCHLHHQVVSLDATRQAVVLADGSRISYDKLILATGSTQESSYIEGSDLPGVLMSKDYANSLEARTVLNEAESIAIIGAGQIGIEASETYAGLGKKVYLFEANPSLDFKIFDGEMLVPLEEAMLAKGIQIAYQQRVQKIEASETGLRVITPSQTVTVDAVMLCAGFRPNTHFLDQWPILAPDRTVEVDAYLRTTLPHVFAVGDMLRLPLLDDRDMSYMPLINTALKTGELASYNLFEPRYPLPLSVRLVSGYHFGWYRTAIGLTADEASLYERISVVDYQAPFSIRDQRPLVIRLVVVQDTGRLLGAQALCQRDCSSLLQALVYPMAEKKTDADLAFQDFLFTAGEMELFYHLHQVLLQSVDKRSETCKSVP